MNKNYPSVYNDYKIINALCCAGYYPQYVPIFCLFFPFFLYLSGSITDKQRIFLQYI